MAGLDNGWEATLRSPTTRTGCGDRDCIPGQVCNCADDRVSAGAVANPAVLGAGGRNPRGRRARPCPFVRLASLEPKDFALGHKRQVPTFGHQERMFSPNPESVTVAVRDDQQRAVLGEVLCTVQQVDTWL